MCDHCGGDHRICSTSSAVRPDLWIAGLCCLLFAVVIGFFSLNVMAWRQSWRLMAVAYGGFLVSIGLSYTQFYPFWAALTGIDEAGLVVVVLLTACFAGLWCYTPAPSPAECSPALPDETNEADVSEAVLVGRLGARLQRQMDALGIDAQVGAVDVGPVLFRFEVRPGLGVKLNTLLSRGDEFATAMKVDAARVSLEPGEGLAVVEVPNPNRQPVLLEGLRPALKHASPLALPLGLSPEEQPVIVNLQEMPHLLMAGTTGAGKSTTLNALLASILERHGPDSLRLVLIDPKRLELGPYAGLPHLVCPPVLEPEEAVTVFEWLCLEMDNRYAAMAALKVKDIEGYNARMKAHPNERLPYIVVVVDELAELMGQIGTEITAAVQSLTQKARACGMHLIFATQRPSTEVISGDIKANFKVRLCLQVADKTASRVALDTDGAEKLMDKGDALLYWPGKRLRRVHCPMIPDQALEALIQRWQAWALQEGWQGTVRHVTDLLKASARPEETEPEFSDLSSGDAEVPGSRKEEMADNAVQEASGLAQPVLIDEGTGKIPEGTQRSAMAEIERNPLLRDAAILAVTTGKLSGAGLHKHLKGQGHRIGKDRIYDTVLPALESAGIIRLVGQGVPPDVLIDRLPFFPSETENTG